MFQWLHVMWVFIPSNLVAAVVCSPFESCMRPIVAKERLIKHLHVCSSETASPTGSAEITRPLCVTFPERRENTPNDP